jgi:nitric oxide reductase subunit B
MVFVSVLPVGFLQLEAAFTESYAVARSVAFYERPLVQALFWARMPGDTLLILGTVLFCWDVAEKLRVVRTSSDAPSDQVVSDRVMVESDN